jgi:hypothetical protein
MNQLDSLLYYVPQLRRLSIGHLNGYRNNRTQSSPITLNCLTNVSLKLDGVSFNDFEGLVSDYFCQVQVLRIRVHPRIFFRNMEEYINADQWKRLISTYISNLRVFDLIQQCPVARGNNERQAYEAEINKFNSSFWVEHQWFFDYQYHPHMSTAVLYSRNPYR